MLASDQQKKVRSSRKSWHLPSSDLTRVVFFIPSFSVFNMRVITCPTSFTRLSYRIREEKPELGY